MNVIEACRLIASEGLVKWSSGNASVRSGTQMLIKPSGVNCAEVAELSAVRLEDGRYRMARKPSTDADTHRFIYNNLPEINGIVHTHSTFATAWAVAGLPIPCCTTAMADEFGGDIPISEFCSIGDDAIGKEVVRYYPSKAVLIRAHGVFTIGKTLEAAVKTAVMLEDIAKVVWHADRMRGLKRLPQEDIDANFKRYSEDYGH